MHDMTRWSFLASLFFSISLCGTAVEVVQGSALLAGAGNPQAMERTLSGFVSRMGGAAVADLPEVPVAVAVELKKGRNDEKEEELAALASFILANGKVKVLAADLSTALGYSAPANIKQKGWQTDDTMKHFSQVNTDNNTDIILIYQNPESVGYMWLTSRSGKLRKTVKTGGGQAIEVPNSEASAEFKAQKEYFLGQIPPTQVAAGETGTN